MSEKAIPKLTRKLMIVDGDQDILELFESVLEPGHYDVVYVETADTAYSKIKFTQPDLVILCVEIDDPEALLLLSMLKLDEQTRKIRVLTYTRTLEELESEEELNVGSEDMGLALEQSRLKIN